MVFVCMSSGALASPCVLVCSVVMWRQRNPITLRRCPEFLTKHHCWSLTPGGRLSPLLRTSPFVQLVRGRQRRGHSAKITLAATARRAHSQMRRLDALTWPHRFAELSLAVRIVAARAADAPSERARNRLAVPAMRLPTHPPIAARRVSLPNS